MNFRNCAVREKVFLRSLRSAVFGSGFFVMSVGGIVLPPLGTERTHKNGLLRRGTARDADLLTSLLCVIDVVYSLQACQAPTVLVVGQAW